MKFFEEITDKHIGIKWAREKTKNRIRETC